MVARGTGTGLGPTLIAGDFSDRTPSAPLGFSFTEFSLTKLLNFASEVGLSQLTERRFAAFAIKNDYCVPTTNGAVGNNSRNDESKTEM